MQAFIANGGLPPSFQCDIEVNWTYDRWLQEGESNLFLGIIYLVFGALYIPCSLVLLQPDLRILTAYKMLFLLTMCQLISLLINSIISGVFFVMGVVYCNFPYLNYFIGCVIMCVWAGSCMTCLILSISRLVDIWSPHTHDYVFGGKSVVFSYIVIFAYGLVFLFYSSPAVFNSRQLSWIFDPLVYPKGGHFNLYACYITIANNELTVGLNVLLTAAFIASLAYKSIRHNFKMTSSQKQLFVQSSFSSLSNLFCASIYVSFQFIVAGRWYTLLGLISWQVATACELILYLVINKTIQRRVLVLIGFKKKTFPSNIAITVTSTVPKQQWKAVRKISQAKT